MSKAKKFNKNESEVALKIMDEPRICSQINLEFKMKRENLQLKILIDKTERKTNNHFTYIYKLKTSFLKFYIFRVLVGNSL